MIKASRDGITAALTVCMVSVVSASCATGSSPPAIAHDATAIDFGTVVDTASPLDDGTDLGVVVTPESGDETTDETSPVDGGADLGAIDSTLADTGVDAGPTDSGATDATADCKSSVAFHPSEAGLYCPFSVSGLDGGAGYCTPGAQHCCESTSADAGPSLCTAAATSCPGTATDWVCSQPSDCPSGQVCCIDTTPPAGMDPGCSYYYLHKFTATTCATSCGSSQLQLCQGGAADCPSGQTCEHVSAKGADFGFCQ